MSKIKFVPILLILLTWIAQTFISCATGVGEFEEKSSSSRPNVSSSSGSEGPDSSSSGQSSSSTTGGSSSSTEGDSSSGSSSSIESDSSSSTGGSSTGGGSSSSSRISSSSSKKEDPSSSSENPLKYGSDLTDSRNGKTYRTVIIGTQTWMESNLNYEPSSASGLSKCYAQGGGNGQDQWLTPEAAKPNCDKYGRLYDWVTAMGLSASCATTSCASRVTAKHQGICPSGWHIPSREEWNVLKDYVYDILWNNYEDEDFDWDVGTKLKAASGWKEHPDYGNGVDTYGFNAIGGGFCYLCDDANLTAAAGSYSGLDAVAHWWSATEYRTEQAWRFKVSYDTNVLTEKYEYRTDLYSVRCVKN